MNFMLFFGNYSLILDWRPLRSVLAVAITWDYGFFSSSKRKTSLPRPLLAPVSMTL